MNQRDKHKAVFLPVFLTLLGKTNGVQINAGHGNTEYGFLTTNLACILL